MYRWPTTKRLSAMIPIPVPQGGMLLLDWCRYCCRCYSQTYSLTVSDSWSVDMLEADAKKEKEAVSKDSSSGHDDLNSAAPVVLEEAPLPRMFVPGKIIHIYSYRGVYKAAYVPRTFRDLRRISLAGNMLSDHTTKGYYEGLLEVQTARVAPEKPPRWTSFDEDDTW